MTHEACIVPSGPHKFEPRYDEVPVGDLKIESSSVSTEALRMLLTRKVYVCDVCVQCGAVVRRP